MTPDPCTTCHGSGVMRDLKNLPGPRSANGAELDRYYKAVARRTRPCGSCAGTGYMPQPNPKEDAP